MTYPSVTRRDGRFIVAARPAPGQRSPGPLRDISTCWTRPVRLALARAATPVRFDDLAAQLADQLRQAEPATIEPMLHGLIDGQALITHLRPPMTAGDPLAHVLAVLRDADTEHPPEIRVVTEQLDDIDAQLRRHNKQTDPRRQADSRAVATELMAAIVPTADEPPLAVDVRLNATISLPQRVLDEAAHAAGVLLRVTTQPFGSHVWLDYHGCPTDHGPAGRAPGASRKPTARWRNASASPAQLGSVHLARRGRERDHTRCGASERRACGRRVTGS